MRFWELDVQRMRLTVRSWDDAQAAVALVDIGQVIHHERLRRSGHQARASGPVSIGITFVLSGTARLARLRAAVELSLSRAAGRDPSGDWPPETTQRPTMRDLLDLELNYVIVAGEYCSPCPPSPCEPAPTLKKGNNGFGNGADANLAAPGSSGATGGGKEGSLGDDRGAR
jgi:hypothetical protein